MSNQHTYRLAIDPLVLREEYESGMTQAEIAKKHGTSQKVVWLLMKKCGLVARKDTPRNQRGKANNNWKPADVITYAAQHKRVESAFGRPKRCDVCGTTDRTRTYDWANLSDHYEDIGDYKRMCRSCHWKFDGKVKNIKRMRNRGVQCQHS